MDDHTCTDCDAPSQLIPSRESGVPHAVSTADLTVERMLLEAFTGPAAVVDCWDLLGSDGPDRSPVIQFTEIIEDIGGLEDVDHIVAVEGVDVVSVSAKDLSQ